MDDDPAALRLLEKEIDELGYPVHAVRDAAAAMEALRGGRFAVTLTDIQMPQMSGLALAAWIRDHTPGVEVILITGYASVESARDALRAGAADYLTKPLADIGEVVRSIERALARRRARASEQAVRAAVDAQLSGIVGLLDWVPQAVIFVDASSRMLSANASAREILAQADALALDGEGRITASEPEKTPALRSLVATAARPAASNPLKASSAISVARGYHRQSLALLVVPLAPHDGTRDPLVAILVGDPLRRAATAESTLCLLYGLTPSEARLGARLIQGHSLDSAAADLGISPNTARVHIRRVFEKTQTSRQADLVSLCLSGPALFSGDER